MKRKILVVDDDKKTVDLIRLSLEKEQFEALVAYEGIEALALTRWPRSLPHRAFRVKCPGYYADRQSDGR